MKKPTVKYSKGEIGRARVVDDFLPSADELVLREDNVKVTLSLSQRSVTRRSSGGWMSPHVARRFQAR